MALVWRSFSLCFPLHHFSVPSKPISFIPQYPSSSSPFLNHRKPQPLTLFSCTCSSTSSSMETPPQGYRRNVGICLINSSKKIFSASRLDIPNAWQMPQGGIDDSEDPKVAALRELKEETGVSSAEIIAEVPFWLTYDFPPEVREKLKHQWGSDWKGQAQKWFLLKFTGKEEEINLLGDGTEKPEFGEWSWMTLEQIVELAVDFKKPVYKKVLEVFTPYLH
ncbi:Nudix hydrolase 26 [Hibiscus syriacus]|uniref:Nudix hydrolase 26 n=1 Tax=Hibiscus syriacus TaxID=106335 RepID=A0A6A3D1W4_HIBSY|nr:nudix hydrolase 26, chloroplastic-like isoform X1 [Hibiscus syriacus]KAE8735743.1 Nudix hydrolase 26 [Hibiscus syriacus]